MNQESAELATRVRNFSVQLSPTPRGARLARLLATEQLRSWGLPLDTASHIVAELAANAVTHGRVPGRDFRILLYVVGDTLRIEVTDTRADRLPHAVRPTPGAESGRGLAIVDALADRWGVTPGLPPRKTVWAEVDLAPEPGNPCSGGTGGHPQRNPRVKEPHRTPPLPPAARTHPRG
ncbi:ATP-binding protein [Streptomyces sp. NPDC093568]|uniref:ATP-binding protein n=1 Tax=Streptomyces sp. NPDC093568 TaxID=3366041 RepID=UPI00381E204B